VCSSDLLSVRTDRKSMTVEPEIHLRHVSILYTTYIKTIFGTDFAHLFVRKKEKKKGERKKETQYSFPHYGQR
jgi:hypothetical protein